MFKNLLRWQLSFLAGSLSLLLFFFSIHILFAQTSRNALPTSAPVSAPVSTLQKRLDAAKEGAVVTVPPGSWSGPIVIRKRVILRGAGGVIDGHGKGKVIIVKAPNVTIENVHVQGSGPDLGGPDSCIWLAPSAKGAILRGNTVRDCAFGIWVHEANDVKILNNRVFGRSKQIDAFRGNGIQLFNGARMYVSGNVIQGARDGIYVSAVHHSVIEKNRLSHMRYGVHYMYSNNNTLRGNITTHNLTGFALMESHHMIVEGNISKNNKHHGILFRDAQYCKITNNRVENNGEGLFFFSSTDNLLKNNLIRGNRVGARIWAGTVRNRITENAFVGNAQQIFFVSTLDLHLGRKEKGNYWSDYMGWDQDKDGIGDRPYRCDSFTANLLYRYPAAVFLLRSPTLELLSHLEKNLPVLRVPTVIDHSPLMGWRRFR